MTGAWFRLGFLTACSVAVLALVELALYRTWWEALTVGTIGLAVAFGLAEDWQHDPPADDKPTPRRSRRMGRQPDRTEML